MAVGQGERTYTLPCPVCGQGARLSVHLDVEAGTTESGESTASTTVTFTFRCLRGCKPHPIELRELWGTAVNGGRPNTA